MLIWEMEMGLMLHIGLKWINTMIYWLYYLLLKPFLRKIYSNSKNKCRIFIRLAYLRRRRKRRRSEIVIINKIVFFIISNIIINLKIQMAFCVRNGGISTQMIHPLISSIPFYHNLPITSRSALFSLEA